MQKHCRQCQSPFTIHDRDRAFYAKMQVPDPTMCPDCRLQRRLTWRMDWTLYLRKCDLTGKNMLSIVSPDSPYKAYHHEAWHSDAWNELDYGQDFDFNRPFFDQFAELLLEVPKMGQYVQSVQNCEYVNQCGWSKNCYFTIEADENEDCMYGYRVFFNKTSVDCLDVFKSERCYEVIDCDKCFNLKHCQLCTQCRDSSFLYDCKSCKNCFGCTGLRQKEYHMFNQELAKEEYEERIGSFDFCNPEHINAARKHFEDLKLKHPRKAFIGEQNEDVSGNYIYQCKNCIDCFDLRDARDCRYCELVFEAKDCMDYFVWGHTAEKVYECIDTGHQVQGMRFCSCCVEGMFDMAYCYQCMTACAHCFGCTGMRKKEYCILNKQYSKVEYEKLIPMIIEHMKETGEWGEFFPMHISPYAYNETTAQEYFPLTKEDVSRQNLRWQDHLPFTKGNESISLDQIPWNISDVEDSICNEVLACEATGRNYRITKQELSYYHSMNLPIPRLHFYERHRRRTEMRNPRKLWKRPCMKCGTEIETSYAPERAEIVYCEKCYLMEVY
jgi:hypothetical protein